MIQIFYIFSEFGIFILRLVVGAFFVRRGLPKIRDLRAYARNFSAMGFRPGLLWGGSVAALEFFGGILLFLGLFTQVAALALALEIALMIAIKIIKRQTFAGGYELGALLLAALLVLTTAGSALYALDSYFRVYFF